MSLLIELKAIYTNQNDPFLISQNNALKPQDVLQHDEVLNSFIKNGDVVALIGDFDAVSIKRLLTIIDKKCILVPLTRDTKPQHEYFFEAAHVDVVVEGEQIIRRQKLKFAHPMLEGLRKKNNAGLVLFSSGTTGMPKAILHDFEQFLIRFRTPRPALITLNFLLFDHIGGINTLFHTLYNKGTIIFPRARTPKDILDDINHFKVEVLPATPTFLRMLLLSGLLENTPLPTLKVITYGTERMEQTTLDAITKMLPKVEFRQTFGMSELGILRVKSTASNELWMFVGGEGVKTKVVDKILKIHAQNKMIGYLNAPSPFDDEGWYDTKDIVDVREDGALRVVGRSVDWINIGGEKILPEVIENAALEIEGVLHAKSKGVQNPITGQHIELTVQPNEGIELDKVFLKKELILRLPRSFIPQKIKIGDLTVSHRFKKL